MGKSWKKSWKKKVGKKIGKKVVKKIGEKVGKNREVERFGTKSWPVHMDLNHLTY